MHALHATGLELLFFRGVNEFSGNRAAFVVFCQLAGRTMDGSPVIPVVVGASIKCIALSQGLLEDGINVKPIVCVLLLLPPPLPPHTHHHHHHPPLPFRVICSLQRVR